MLQKLYKVGHYLSYSISIKHKKFVYHMPSCFDMLNSLLQTDHRRSVREYVLYIHTCSLLSSDEDSSSLSSSEGRSSSSMALRARNLDFIQTPMCQPHWLCWTWWKGEKNASDVEAWDFLLFWQFHSFCMQNFEQVANPCMEEDASEVVAINVSLIRKKRKSINKTWRIWDLFMCTRKFFVSVSAFIECI